MDQGITYYHENVHAKNKLKLIGMGLMYIISTRIIIAQTALDVSGSIRIGNTVSTQAQPGSIRWTGSDFEGFTGLYWGMDKIDTAGSNFDTAPMNFYG